MLWQPELYFAVRLAIAIPRDDFWNLVEYLPVMTRAKQTQVFRMGPQQGIRRTGRAATTQMSFRNIRFIPNLLRQQASSVRELLHGMQKGAAIMARGKLIMSSLTGQ